jgi:hypothetical protein
MANARTYRVFEQRLEQRFAPFRVRVQLAKEFEWHALRVQVSEKWQQPRIRPQQSAAPCSEMRPFTVMGLPRLSLTAGSTSAFVWFNAFACKFRNAA